MTYTPINNQSTPAPSASIAAGLPLALTVSPMANQSNAGAVSYGFPTTS